MGGPRGTNGREDKLGMKERKKLWKTVRRCFDGVKIDLSRNRMVGNSLDWSGSGSGELPRSVSVLQAEACNTDTTPTQPHRNSNTHRTKNNTTNVVIQQNSR